MGGGMIVGFLCVFKVLMSKADVSEFGHAVLYSFNYALGFITIYLLGFTLATKQPAMTAAAIVKSIEVGTKKSIAEKDRHLAFAKLFSQLFRSQFIAFVGNVLVAFPVSLFVVWLSVYLFNYNFATEKSDTLLRDLSPIHSAAIFHAAIAGVFLFLSGIISGAISNRNKHKRVYYRFAEHPFLKKTIGKQKTRELAERIEQKWPGIASNLWFGVFMGSTAIIGVFFGLNLDIRHITFASGNFALGLFGSNFDVSTPTLFWGIVGIGIIGFVNFIVSFLLSLALAFRSRNIQTSEIKYLFKSVWYYFKKKPFSFFIPTK
jgi:site-specific recombinase